MSAVSTRFGPHWSRMLGPGEALAPTPAGDPCLYCTEPISDGDSGQLIGSVRADNSATVVPAHVECLALHTTGHVYGVCSCTNMAGATTEREAALELWRRMQDRGTPVPAFRAT